MPSPPPAPVAPARAAPGAPTAAGLGAMVAVWAAAALPWAWHSRGLALDDFFVTYRYAWNLSHGHGFVFNVGEHVFGLTCPGFGLLLAVLSGPWHADVPDVATAVYALSLLGVAALLAAEESRLGRGWALAGGLLIASSSFLWKSSGSESVPALFLLLLAARWVDRRPALAGMVAATAVFFRPESALALGILTLLRWREGNRPPWRFAVVAAATLGAGAIACRLAFDTWLPLTLRSKRSLASMDGSHARFWSDAWASWSRHEATLALVFVVAAFLGLALLVLRGGRGVRLLALFAIALAAAYGVLGVPFFVWYVVPLAVVAYYAAAAAGAELARWVLRRPSTGLRRVATVAVCAGALLVVGLLLRDRSEAWRVASADPRLVAYREAASWIREHSAPDARVAYVEIGVLAYYGERAVDDLLGLVTPRSLPYAERGDLEGAFLAQPAEFALHHDGRGRMRQIVNKPWFKAAYDEAFLIRAPGDNGSVHVFRRRPGAALPPPRRPRGSGGSTP